MGVIEAQQDTQADRSATDLLLRAGGLAQTLGFTSHGPVNFSASILDSDGTRFVAMIDQLDLASWNIRYTFMANEEFAQLVRNDPSRGMQVYWGEVLARAHLTAATAILRSRHWVSAVIAAAEIKNLLSFAAALRGLIESAADTSSALGQIPCTLARDHAQIMLALSGHLRHAVFISSEIEDKLIHFSYARHLTKAELATTPTSHKAMKVRDYIEVLEKGRVTNIIECYRALCDLTHPGASSVWMWLHPVNDLEMDLKVDQDDSVIAYFLEEYRRTIVELLMFAFNPAIVTLRTLNYFPLAKLHVPALENWNMTGIPLWQKCQADLTGLTPKTDERLRNVKPNASL